MFTFSQFVSYSQISPLLSNSYLIGTYTIFLRTIKKTSANIERSDSSFLTGNICVLQAFVAPLWSHTVFLLCPPLFLVNRSSHLLLSESQTIKWGVPQTPPLSPKKWFPLSSFQWQLSKAHPWNDSLDGSLVPSYVVSCNHSYLE